MSAFSKKNWGLKLSLMCRHPARLLLHIYKYTWLTASLIQDHAEPAPTFFTWSNIMRFRIVRCNRQAALHSAIFNYTRLVIGGADKNKQLTNIKPTQTGINRNKW
jgi:hypothetical protein